jgi:hypothetical protein
MSVVTIKSTFPEEAAKYIADLVTGKKKFNRWEAITHGMTLANYLVDLFGNSSSVKSKTFKAGRVSKKQIADALNAACSGGNPAVKAAVPVWLLPVILNLVKAWLDGSKKG